MKKSVATSAHGAGEWKGMSDSDWAKWKDAGGLPDFIDGRSCRVILDRILENAFPRRRHMNASISSRDVKRLLRKLHSAPIGCSLNDIVEAGPRAAEIRSRLQGALIVLRGWRIEDQGKLEEHVRSSSEVTRELKILAGVSRQLGAGSRPNASHGGSHDPSDRILLSELLNFWRFRRPRECESNDEIKLWVDPAHDPLPKGSPLIEFVRVAFEIAEIPDAENALGSDIILHRVRRALRAMDKAEKAGLEWNILAPELNKDWRTSRT